MSSPSVLSVSDGVEGGLLRLLGVGKGGKGDRLLELLRSGRAGRQREEEEEEMEGEC